MERSFPRISRRHVSWTLALVATTTLASGPAMLANADDLHQKKGKAHQQVKAAQADLEDSSAAFYAASAKVKAAQASLVSAQKRYAVTQGQLNVARALDTQMQAKLVSAQSALTEAKAAVAAGIARIKEQRADLGRMVASNYEYGDPRLLGLSAVLHAQDLNELTTQLYTIDNVMDDQQSLLDDYEAQKAQLVVEQKKVKAAEQAVAEQRQAAAVNLAKKQALEEKAAAARVEVVNLVNARAGLARQAAVARAADQAKLRASRRQEAKIQKLILARAAQHKGGFTGSSNGFLLSPVKDTYVTSPYGYRVHPIYGYYSLHDGDDFHAPCGVPERAAASGTVISEYYSDVWGNRLYLDVGKVNGKSMTLIYNHISSYKAHTGDRVQRGDTVAYAGTTGWSTGCHLHFTVLVDGNPVDPQKYM